MAVIFTRRKDRKAFCYHLEKHNPEIGSLSITSVNIYNHPLKQGLPLSVDEKIEQEFGGAKIQTQLYLTLKLMSLNPMLLCFRVVGLAMCVVLSFLFKLLQWQDT